MIQVKDYKLIYSYKNLEQFEQMVKKMMEEGWELSGGVCINNDFFYQAMYKDRIE